MKLGRLFWQFLLPVRGLRNSRTLQLSTCSLFQLRIIGILHATLAKPAGMVEPLPITSLSIFSMIDDSSQPWFLAFWIHSQNPVLSTHCLGLSALDPLFVFHGPQKATCTVIQSFLSLWDAGDYRLRIFPILLGKLSPPPPINQTA